MSETKPVMSDEEIDNLWIIAWKALKQESCTYGPLQLEGRRAFARRLLAEFAERVAAMAGMTPEDIRQAKANAAAGLQHSPDWHRGHTAGYISGRQDAARIVREAAK